MLTLIPFQDAVCGLAAGSVMGFLTGMTGVGPGALAMPSLLYVIGMPPVSAVGTSMFFSMLTRFEAGYQHAKLKTVRWRTAAFFAAGSVPAVIASAIAVNKLSSIYDRQKFDFCIEIFVACALFMIFCVAAMDFLKERRGLGNRAYYTPPRVFPARRKLLCLGAGFMAGLVLGATSLGQGVLIVPVLIVAFNLSPSNAAGTGSAVSLVLTLAGTIVYGIAGNIDFPVALVMFAGAVPGVIYGSRISVRVSGLKLKKTVLLILLVAICSMLAGLIFK